MAPSVIVLHPINLFDRVLVNICRLRSKSQTSRLEHQIMGSTAMGVCEREHAWDPTYGNRMSILEAKGGVS